MMAFSVADYGPKRSLLKLVYSAQYVRTHISLDVVKVLFQMFCLVPEI